MKRKKLVLAIVFFFLCINTMAYWEGKLGMLAFPAFTVLFMYYLVLVVLFFRHLLLAYQERFNDGKRLAVLTSLAIVLVLTFFKPHGSFDFDRFAGEDVLVANHEGPANCTTTLKFKANGHFIDKTVCFGVSEIKGRYYKKGDTLFFSVATHAKGDKKQHAFAVIRPSASKNGLYMGSLIAYQDKNDSVGHRFGITKNTLTKK